MADHKENVYEMKHLADRDTVSQHKKHRVGIMGGTFDPIHIGHLILAECAYEQFELETVLFLPSGNPPHKADRPDGADDRQRLEMVSIAIADNPHFSLDAEEMKRAWRDVRYTYTDDTLRMLTGQHPDTEYYFIIGADSLMSFDTWKNPRGICSNCILLAAVRDQFSEAAMKERIRELEMKYHASIFLLHSPDIEISSSNLRARYRQGLSLRYYVPDRVLDYIEKNGIYSAVQ